MKSYLLISLTAQILLLSSFTYAQAPPAAPVYAPTSSGGQGARPGPLYTTSTDPYVLALPPPGTSLPLDIKKEVREKLKISDAERDEFRQIINDKKANIIRLMSEMPCDKRYTVDVKDERCSGNGQTLLVSFYSFRYKTYLNNILTDIQLTQGQFVAGNVKHTPGFLVDLGNTDLNKVDLNSEAATVLLGLPKLKNLAEEADLNQKLAAGFAQGNVFISYHQKAELNHTYLIRTIAYRIEGEGASWFNVDSMYVFRVVKLDPDNTVTLAWKKIYEKEAPLLRSAKQADKDK